MKTVFAFAGTSQTDITYNGETYTIYARCDALQAAANIRTISTTETVGVLCCAYTELGEMLRGVDSGQMCEAVTRINSRVGYELVYADAEYYIGGRTVATRTVYTG